MNENLVNVANMCNSVKGLQLSTMAYLMWCECVLLIKVLRLGIIKFSSLYNKKSAYQKWHMKSCKCQALARFGWKTNRVKDVLKSDSIFTICILK